MAISITSIGTVVSYAVEETKGAGKPETGYKRIPGILEIPDMNPTPETAETTSMDNTEYRTYVPLLKDLGGALAFTVRLSQELYDLWEGTGGIMESWKTAKSDGRRMFLCIDIAGLNKSCYLSVEPASFGMPAASTNSVVDHTIYFTPLGEPEWGEDPKGDYNKE